MDCLLFFSPHAVLILMFLAEISNHSWAPVIPIFIVWIIFPIIDFFTGQIPGYKFNSKQEEKFFERRWSFRLVLYSWIPFQFAFLTWACFRSAELSITSIRFLALAANTGLMAAEGINVAHELLHKRNSLEVYIAEILLVCACYGHFIIEHAIGHHKNVATPQDPATMRFGESFYSFLPRTVFGGFRSALMIEKSRLRSEGKSPWSVRNRVLRYSLSSILIILAINIVIGRNASLFFVLQAFFAIVLLEQINAIEHYGLNRKISKSGYYESVKPQHSWDTGDRFSNFLLFKLQNHADHHTRRLNFPIKHGFRSNPEFKTNADFLFVQILLKDTKLYLFVPKVQSYLQVT